MPSSRASRRAGKMAWVSTKRGFLVAGEAEAQAQEKARRKPAKKRVGKPTATPSTSNPKPRDAASAVLSQLRRLLADDPMASDAQLARGLNRCRTGMHADGPLITPRQLPELRARVSRVSSRRLPPPTREQLKRRARDAREERRRAAAAHPVSEWDPEYRRVLIGELRRYRRREGRVVALAEMVTAANRVHARQAQRFTGLPPLVTSAHVRDLLADLRAPNAKTRHPEKPKPQPKVALGHTTKKRGAKAKVKTARTRRRDGGVG